MSNNNKNNSGLKPEEFAKIIQEEGINAAIEAGSSRSKGLGDLVEDAIKRVSGGKIKTCPKCQKRKEKLNNLFRKKKTPPPGGGEA